MRNARRTLAALAAFCFAGGAAAHVTSTGLAMVTVDGRSVIWRVTLAPAELPENAARLIARAADGIEESAAQLAGHLRQHVKLASGGEPCRPGRVRVQGSRASEVRAVLEVEFTCARPPLKLHLTDTLGMVFGEHYRTIASVVDADGSRAERIFDAANLSAAFELAPRAAQGWSGFFTLGVEHILTGWDHLLFLAALLAGTTGIWRVLAIVTAFTIAHSITLALSVLQIAAIPDSIVEPAIAASITWVALENLYSRRAAARRWVISLAFGLVHGFGFAGALSDSGLSDWPLGRALIGFNLGVEAGQACVVLLLVPFFAWLARLSQGPRYADALSVLLALAGGTWFVVRIVA